MIVKFKRMGMPVGLAYFPGDIVDIQNNELAKNLVEDDFVDKVDSNSKEKIENVLPKTKTVN